MTDGALRIGPVRSSVVAGVARVEAVVSRPVWFESSDVELEPSPEAFASALLLAAASDSIPLEVADPVSATWREGVQHILETWHEWWGCSTDVVRAATTDRDIGDAASSTRSREVALCFTGGVDSFHTLLCHEPRPSVLAYCHGYDIYLHDEVRAAAWCRSFATIARELDTRPAWIRTNLRTNEPFAGLDWERSHGGALAALGHLLGGTVGVLLVSTGLPDDQAIPWGSHPRVDARWSSDRVEIRRYGGDRTRLQKVGDIVGHELPQQHLRVCWEHGRPTGNCSRCDKCLNTMLLVDAWGAAPEFAVFDWSGRLDRHLDEVPTTLYVRTYRDLLETAPPRRVARAIRRLLRRTHRHHPERAVAEGVTPRR